MATISESLKKKPLNIAKNFFEKTLWSENKPVVGIDEVGRGCLAGPLVTAAVILPIGKVKRILKDSKLLDKKEREDAYVWIINNCYYQIGIVHHRLIDQHNIWHATIIAMKRALIQLISSNCIKPGAILVDAMPLTIEDLGLAQIPVYYFNKGESKSSSIAAASIIAKVTRDRLMHSYEMAIPGYHFTKHKGYATKIHKNCLKTLRPSIIHRQTFLRSLVKTEDLDDQNNQQSLCRNS